MTRPIVDPADAELLDAYASSNGRRPVTEWPKPMGEAAYRGVVGELVRAIEPHSEADPAAMILQILTHVGNACGRQVWWTVENTDRYLNLFVAVVGATATARKGTSFKQSRRPLELTGADLGPAAASGLSSGEGLIGAVRDPTYRKAKKDEEGNSEGMVVDDEGVLDKRLLVVETELGSVVGRMGRQENVLSAVLRQAWDGDVLRVLTKRDPVVATGSHVSLIGHITHEELRKLLSSTDVFSGFANRILWTCARRSKLLPEDGGDVDWGDSVKRLGSALAKVQSGQVGRIGLDEEARERWWQEYERLVPAGGGPVVAATSRAEAQVRRVACIYAVLGLSGVVRLEHLEAALEVWRYCRDSAAYLFGGSTGDPTADQILNGLRRADGRGLNRTDISALLGRHVPKKVIDQKLLILSIGDLADMQKDGGTEWWRAR